ncbi:hypothetical protein ECE50_017520 [Chitinophaga sp. Mgbs1]|uniref:Core-binding (CB) domain-containing protein n=1 Tax=Chitinophaga solisilvae TaxID=1233460 RepID=A0A9Q5D645_9BACT|nr:hypothetical protein [Chitinophaga solisilvae]
MKNQEKVEDPGLEFIEPTDLFIEALWKAFRKLDYVPETLRNIKYIIQSCDLVAAKLNYAQLPIASISRKHINRIFQYLRVSKPNEFTVNRRNNYRAYLLQLFRQVLKQEAIEHNPITDIEVEKEKSNKEEILNGTPEGDELLTIQERYLIPDTYI